MSFGVACNFYREPFALPGFLEMANSGYFDDVVMLSSPPSGAKPDEESIELVKKAGVRLVHTTIDAGYGVIRTRCIRESQAEWVLIADCDERFHVELPQTICEGTEGYPHVKNPNLKVTRGSMVAQGAQLKERLAQIKEADAFRVSRRHWFCEPGAFTKPCQNWHLIPDWQLRIVRNSPFIFYDPDIKMHEKILDSRTWSEPRWATGDEHQGPFLDHYHFHHKQLDPEGRKLAVETYKKLDEPATTGMWSVAGFD